MRIFILFFILIGFTQSIFSQYPYHSDSSFIRKNKIKKISLSRVIKGQYYKNTPKGIITEFFYNKLGQPELIKYYNDFNGENNLTKKYIYNSNNHLISVYEYAKDEINYRYEYTYVDNELVLREEYAKENLRGKYFYQNNKLYKKEAYFFKTIESIELYKYDGDLIDSTIYMTQGKGPVIAVVWTHFYDENGVEIKRVRTDKENSKVVFSKTNKYNEHDSLIEHLYDSDNSVKVQILYNRRNDTLMSEDYVNTTGTKMVTNYSYKNGLISEIKYASNTPKKDVREDIYEFNKDSLLSKIVCFNDTVYPKYHYFFYNSKKQLIEKRISSSNDTVNNRTTITLYTYDTKGDTLISKSWTNDFVNGLRVSCVSDTFAYDFKTKESYVVHSNYKNFMYTGFLNYHTANQVDSIRDRLKLDRRRNSWYGYQFENQWIYYPVIKKTFKPQYINSKSIANLKIKMFSSHDDIMYPSVTITREIYYTDNKHYEISDFDKQGNLLFHARIKDTIIITKRFCSRTLFKHHKDYLYKFDGNYQPVISEITYYNSLKQPVKKKRFASNNSIVTYNYDTPYEITETDDYKRRGSVSHTIKQYDPVNHMFRLIRSSKDYRIVSRKEYYIHNHILHEMHIYESTSEFSNLYDYEFYK